jgi:hypothetical protein
LLIVHSLLYCNITATHVVGLYLIVAITFKDIVSTSVNAYNMSFVHQSSSRLSISQMILCFVLNTILHQVVFIIRLCFISNTVLPSITLTDVGLHLYMILRGSFQNCQATKYTLLFKEYPHTIGCRLMKIAIRWKQMR